jgi:hypothetical protein
VFALQIDVFVPLVELGNGYGEARVREKKSGKSTGARPASMADFAADCCLEIVA